MGFKACLEKGDCRDNAVAESFLWSLKCGMIYGNRTWSAEQIELDIFQWIEIWHDKIRPYKKLDNVTIDEFWSLNKKVFSNGF